MRRLIVLSACALAIACTGETPATSDAPASGPAAPADMEAQNGDTAGETAPTPRGIALPAGEHCYFRDAEDVTEALEIIVTETGKVSGSSYGNIHQEANAYYASFDIELTEGTPTGDGLMAFDSVTQVDGDTQTGTMTWSITPDAAAPEGFLDAPMQPADCEGLTDRVFPQPGEE